MWPQIRRPGSRSARTAPHHQYLPVGPSPTAAADAVEAGAQAGPRWSGLYEGEPAHCRRDARQFAAIFAHLGLMVAVFKVFRVEGPAFYGLSLLTLAALPIHYALPLRLKKPAFVAASLAALGWIFDAPTALTAVGVGAALIGACYLPVAWAWRAGIVGAIAAA
ncbi:MAG: hypothetical protein K2X91_08025, partial [Thermoleophilia bacterium]|nr:hypothetical protein [Thermoleophilia bacterium]